MRTSLILASVVLLSACGGTPPTGDLAISLNPRCTTCDDFVRCEPDQSNAAVYDPSFELYHLKPKGTFAQIMTIFDYLADSFRERREDRRPMAVYVQRRGTAQAFDRQLSPNEIARIDLTASRLIVPGGWVDQTNGAWYAEDGTRRGQCRALTRQEGRELAALFGPPAATP